MDRNSLVRLLFIAGAVFLAMSVLPQFFGHGSEARQPLQPETVVLPSAQSRPPERVCDLWGPGFHAQVSTRGGGLKHFWLLDAKYKKDGKPIDLSTTPDIELYRQLRFQFRNSAAGIPEGEQQLAFDSVDFSIQRASGRVCELSYRDERVELTQTLKTTGRPYEVEATAVLKNLSGEQRRHTLSVYTEAWRTEQEVHGGMFRVSPLLTHVECVPVEGDTVRLHPQDFEAGDFENKEHFPRTKTSAGDWYLAASKPALGAVSNAYFSHAVVPLAGGKPECQLLIEDRWDNRRFESKGADPGAGAIYRARMAYPTGELAPGAEARYSVLAYAGPKERRTLEAAAGGSHRLIELIDLGFFSSIAKILVAFLLQVYGVIPNWGIAIIVLTITARVLLFPLAVPGIKGMIKMRELKPEIDAINEKFKDDPQQKGLAQMELWRKHNVNPVKGCLPQLASMPVWFALYTTLQTAVELFNIPFLWFPDLSSADPFYVLPFVIGATSFFQQKLMPMQGDPAQQKMLLYFMPAMFTVFMLFLPAGLGVYMFTNGVLGIIQQQAVEWHVRRSIRPGGGSGSGDIRVKVVEDSSATQRGSEGRGRRSGNGAEGPTDPGNRRGRMLREGKT
jgi:YidC/Oxa1 family membrane protein insertase